MEYIFMWMAEVMGLRPSMRTERMDRTIVRSLLVNTEEDIPVENGGDILALGDGNN